ncbi:MAG: helix-hairpin-helix domain-containing protein [Bacteroidota bacterium]
MRNFLSVVFVFVLTSMLMVACKEAKEKENSDGETSNLPEVKSDSTNVTETTIILNANLATEADLLGIGLASEKVTQIIKERPFLTMKDFDALLETTVDKTTLYQKVFVPLNLNTTAEADFKIIPGVGDRMAHEFEEYRPYTNIAQFRREIGKYVDEEEVSRYENYVFVPVDLNTASEESILALPGVGKRMAHEFEEYRPYTNMAQFRKEIGKYVDEQELTRLERLVYINE